MKRIILGSIKGSFDEIYYAPAIVAVCWLIGEVVTALLYADDAEATLFPISTIFTVYLGAMIMTILGVSRICVEYPFLLQFPATRRGALLGQSCTIVLHGLAVFATALVLGLASTALHGVLYAGMPQMDMFSIVPWPAWPLLLAGELLLSLVIGGFVIRFGKKALWAFYILVLLLSQLTESILHWFAEAMPPANLPLLFAALGAALLALVAVSLRWLLRAAAQC